MPTIEDKDIVQIEEAILRDLPLSKKGKMPRKSREIRAMNIKLETVIHTDLTTNEVRSVLHHNRELILQFMGMLFRQKPEYTKKYLGYWVSVNGYSNVKDGNLLETPVDNTYQSLTEVQTSVASTP